MLSGVLLAGYLGSFSERGDVYTEEIVAMILENNLEATWISPVDQGIEDAR